MEGRLTMTFEILEWHNRRYQHLRYIDCSETHVERLICRMNEGYTGPRFIFREV